MYGPLARNIPNRGPGRCYRVPLEGPISHTRFVFEVVIL